MESGVGVGARRAPVVSVAVCGLASGWWRAVPVGADRCLEPLRSGGWLPALAVQVGAGRAAVV